MSLIKILKSSGPNIDPCETPALKELFPLQHWSLFVRQLLIKLTALLSKPYTSSFANNKSKDYNIRIIFIEKWYAKCGGETSPGPFSKKLKLSISLDQ